ncbi:hypothetical protein CQ13_28705 [Bradyrhizobium retamae]|uniref:Uncharacterized protein n=1 Tax=Bradyrhizobium retamae TaxID=1300035 RepID=A0A0R3MXD5_9BRAD|nr:hypothetical protein CQ13_28705 [Bradyrhizobium retamae]
MHLIEPSLKASRCLQDRYFLSFMARSIASPTGSPGSYLVRAIEVFDRRILHSEKSSYCLL